MAGVPTASGPAMRETFYEAFLEKNGCDSRQGQQPELILKATISE
jgi:hypothetical protein